jgi:hypothetical protein
MITCRTMRFRFDHCARSEERRKTVRQILDRRYAGGEIDKEHYEVMNDIPSLRFPCDISLEVNGVTRVLQHHAGVSRQGDLGQRPG